MPANTDNKKQQHQQRFAKMNKQKLHKHLSAVTKSSEKKKKKERQEQNKERRKKHDQSVREATAGNVAACRQGKVKVGKLTASSDGNKTWPHVDGFKNVNVGAGSRGDVKQLIPCYLGPIPLRFSKNTPRVVAQNMEVMWKFSRVFKKDIDSKGQPTKEWYKWRNKGWSDPEGHHWVDKDLKGRKSDEQPVYFILGQSRKLGFVTARTRIFCRTYAKLVIRTPGYKKLLDLIDKGINIHIMGPQGYDYAEKNGSLDDCLFDGNRPFGHELILAGLLTGDTPWVKGSVRGTPPTMIPTPAKLPVLAPLPPPAKKQKQPQKKKKKKKKNKGKKEKKKEEEEEEEDQEKEEEEELKEQEKEEEEEEEEQIPNGTATEPPASPPRPPRTRSQQKRKAPTATVAPPPPPPLPKQQQQTTTTTKVVAQGQVKLAEAPPPPLKKRRKTVGEIPIWIIKEPGDKLPKNMLLFSTKEDAYDELLQHNPDGSRWLRDMTMWPCDVPSDDDNNKKKQS